MLKTGDVWRGVMVARDATGALSAPTVGPTGALYLNSVSDAATVTVSGTNPYFWSVTLPTLASGDMLTMYMTATIDSIATGEVVAEGVADTKRNADLNDLAAGAAMTLTAAYDAAKAAATQASVDGVPTNAEFEARTLPAADYVVVGDTLARVTLVDTTTTNTDMVAAAPGAATVADAVWDEALAGHLGAGSTGEALNAAGAAGDPWVTALPGGYGAGSAGKIIGDNLNEPVSAAKTLTAAYDAAKTAATQASVNDVPTVAEFGARTLLAADYFDPAADAVANVTLVGTTTTNTDMRGTDNAALALTALSSLVWTDAKAGYLTGAVALEATLTAIKGAGWSAETLVAIDALIDAIKAKTDLIPASPAAIGSEMSLTAAYDAAKTAAQAGDAMALTGAAIDDILDEIVEGAFTMRQILRLLNSFIGAKVAGGGTATITFRDVGDTKPRITMTVDPLTGDRSAVVLDGA